jgi:hypothetical protein
VTRPELLLIVREVDPALQPDPDGLLHPIPGASASEVLHEARDGANIASIPSKGLTLLAGRDNALRTIASIDEVAIRVAITDARVAVACSKFDKGGGWIGSAGAMALANTVSMGLAAARRRGKMLVGHARYPWIYAVGASPKAGLFDTETVRICMHTESAEALVLDLSLPTDLAAPEVAAEIARRVASYRLACGHDPEHLHDLEALQRVQPVQGANGWYGFHVIPGSLPISDQSARLYPRR